jgi:cytoskeletal protein RodZ
MSQLGERLRATRESQGINVSQAAAETRILPRYIIALEDGDYQHLPGDVYARGFIRNYANYLGIPAEELIELYRLERGVTDPIRVMPATSSPRIRGLFVPSFFGVFFIVLLLVGTSYLVLNLTNSVGESSVAEVPFATVAPTPPPLPTWPVDHATSAPVVADAPTPQPEQSQPIAGAAPTPQPEQSQPVAGGAAPSPTPQAAPIVATVRIAEGDHKGSWIRITADNQKLFEGVLKPGSFRDFTAQGDVQIRAGNAGVVFVTINGAEQGPLGAIGDVFNFSWPPR